MAAGQASAVGDWETVSGAPNDEWEDVSGAPKQSSASIEAEAAANPPATPKFDIPKSAMETVGAGVGDEAAGNAAMGERYVEAGPKEVGRGIRDVAKGDIAKGGHETIQGLGVTAMPAALPAAPFAIAEAPVAFATGAAGSYLGGKGTRKVAAMAGANEDQQNFAEDLGQIGGGLISSGGPIRKAVGKMAGRAALLGRTPEGAYESALKPSTTLGEAERAAITQTGLKEGIPVSQGGLEKVGDLIDTLNQQVKDTVATNPNAPVNKFAVASRLGPVAQRSAMQVTPEADLSAVSETGNEFLRNQPNEIPAETAQAMKTGTYRALGNKAYGELKGASIEAQKALARGLKEEIASQFPELASLNKREGALIDLQDVLERSVARIGNHQIMGIGTPIAAGAATAVTGSNKVGAAVGLIKAVLDNPYVKSKLAIALSRAGVPQQAIAGRIAAYIGALSQYSGRAVASQQGTQSDSSAESSPIRGAFANP